MNLNKKVIFSTLIFNLVLNFVFGMIIALGVMVAVGEQTALVLFSENLWLQVVSVILYIPIQIYVVKHLLDQVQVNKLLHLCALYVLLFTFGILMLLLAPESISEADRARELVHFILFQIMIIFSFVYGYKKYN